MTSPTCEELEEVIRELHEAIIERTAAKAELRLSGNGYGTPRYFAAERYLDELAKQLPNGASALAELERLRGIIRDIRRAAPQNYQYMIKLCDDALSERSTSPAEEQS